MSIASTDLALCAAVKRPRILIISPFQEFLQTVTDHLGSDQELSPQFDHARTIAEAIDCLRNHPYDTAIAHFSTFYAGFFEEVDPGDTSDAAAAAAVESLSAVREGVPLVAVVASPLDTDRRACLAAGAEDVVAEGELTAALLARVVRYAIERRRVLENTRESFAELERMRCDLTDFSRVISHELKTLLTVIRMEIEAAGRALSPSASTDTAKSSLDEARNEIDQLTRLIDDLVRYFRLSQTDTTPETIDLNHLVRQAADRCLASTPGVDKSQVEIRIGGQLPPVRGIIPQLRQLFEHLIANTLKYRGPDGSDIRIAGERLGGRVAVTVADNGPGVRESDRHRELNILDCLTGQPHTNKDIGLAIAQRIVELHGGALSLSGGHEPPGAPPAPSSAAFHFTLPTAQG